LLWLQENAELLILVFAVLALLLVLLKLFRSRVSRHQLESDRSGFFKYHKDSQFKRVAAYAELLEQAARDLSGNDKGKKPKTKKSKKDKARQKVVAVIEFDGDIRAKQRSGFAHLVDELEINRHLLKEVVVSITSPGGMVPQYGHAYAQMERIRSFDIPLTACVDVVAASGGYLMCLPANKIIAAPFAVVGSVGVMAFVPNVRGLLQNINVEPRTFTSGNYKRTVTLTDNAKPEEIAHFQGQLENIHKMFVDAVAKYRNEVQLEEVKTGDHWSAVESLEKGLGLVDELGTTQEYLMKLNRENDLVYLSAKRGMFEGGINLLSASLAEQVENRLFAVNYLG